MKLNRRRFLGVAGLGSAGLIIAPATAIPRVLTAGIREPEPTLLTRARAAFDRHASVVRHRDVMGIVDFAEPSHAARFHLVDFTNGKVATYLVAHGRGSDPTNKGWVEQLSNRPGSHASCAGSFLTGETYIGRHGRSRRLAGLDPENDLAAARAIVIHAARYVDDSLALSHGRIGRSHGCFAVSQGDISEVLERLGPGRLLFAAKPATP
jgi:hypothetical protein